MTGWTIRATQGKEPYNDRTKYWVMTAYMKSIENNDMMIDPVYKLRKGYNPDVIKWIGMDALVSYSSLEQAECYIEEWGGTKKLGNGYITDANYEYIYDVKESE